MGPYRARAAAHRALWRARLVALGSSGAAPELWDLFARAASNRARLVALGSSGAAPELWDLIARAASHRALWRERLVALDSSGAATELWDVIARAASHAQSPLEIAFSRVGLFRSRRGALGLYRAHHQILRLQKLAWQFGQRTTQRKIMLLASQRLNPFSSSPTLAMRSGKGTPVCIQVASSSDRAVGGMAQISSRSWPVRSSSQHGFVAWAGCSLPSCHRL